MTIALLGDVERAIALQTAAQVDPSHGGEV